ncbi:THAP domain-containing protein 10 isoform X2 [Rhipicephalus microplus]|uniref:THAP domain-containing protein 10 isoform X2 n=1 Tax=Rhipicephalus microplus TaxID=6941 RepID=UPI003F6CACE2
MSRNSPTGRGGRVGGQRHRFRVMPQNYCAVARCPSRAVSDVAYHKFPVDSPQRQQWIDFVRSSGRGLAWTPRMSSRVCSRHFAPSCYRHDPVRLAQLGFPVKGLLLVPGALPTVYLGVDHRDRRGADPRPAGGAASTAEPIVERPRLESCSGMGCGPAVLVANHVVRMVKRTTTTGPEKADASTQCAVRMTMKATQALSHPRGLRTVAVQTMISMANERLSGCASTPYGVMYFR